MRHSLLLFSGLFLSGLLISCSSSQKVVTQYEARMDSTTVRTTLDLSESKDSYVSDRVDLRLTWQVRCPGRASTCTSSELTAILSYVGSELEYSPDTELGLWMGESTDSGTEYDEVWASFASDRAEEIGYGLAGQGLYYRVPRGRLEDLVGKDLFRIGITDDGPPQFFTPSGEQREKMQAFLGQISGSQ